MVIHINLGQVPRQDHTDKILQALEANLADIRPNGGTLKYLFRGFVGLDILLDDYVKGGTDTPDLEYTRMHPIISVAFYYMVRPQLIVEFDGETTPVGKAILNKGLPLPDYLYPNSTPLLRVYPIRWFEGNGLHTFSGLFVYNNDSVMPTQYAERYKPRTTFADAARLLLTIR